MAASQPTFGMQHLTVVPANFDPQTEDEEIAEVDDEQ